MSTDTQSTAIKKPALYFVIFTVLMDSVGFGIILPVMPKLIMSLTGEEVSGASAYGGLLVFIFAIMQFIFSPILGNLSDRFGRRPILLGSVAMLAVDYLIMGFATSIFWLFVARAMSGMAAATFGTANAYVADIIPAEHRAKSFGLLGAAFGVGFIIGPVIGGFLGEYGPKVPFFVAAALSVVSFIFGYVFLEESLPLTERRPFEWRKANAFYALKNLRMYPMLAGLSVAYFIHHIAHWVLPSTWSYFTIEKFSWSERDIGYSLGLVGIFMVLVQGFLIRPVMDKLGERKAAMLAYVAISFGFIAFASVDSSLMLYLTLIPFALSGFINPAFQGIMTAQVSANSQGEFQGALNSLNSITAVIGPLLMTQTFSFFTAETAPIYFPGAPFVLAAVLSIISFIVFVLFTRDFDKGPDKLSDKATEKK